MVVFVVELFFKRKFLKQKKGEIFLYKNLIIKLGVYFLFKSYNVI